MIGDAAVSGQITRRSKSHLRGARLPEEEEPEQRPDEEQDHHERFHEEHDHRRHH
jgi:hypothetical protein